MATYACTINGSAALLGRGWRISAPANGRATLTGRITATTPAAVPAIDQTITITEDATTLFAGLITGVRSRGIDGNPTTELDVEITAADNNSRATRRHLVNVTVAAGTSLRDAMDVIVAYLPGGARSGSQPVGPSLSAGFTASAWRADEALDYLTKDTGYLWGIDGANVLSMWEPGTLTAPFDVIDGDGHTDGDVEVEPQRSEFATKVIVMAAGGLVGTATDSSYASNPWELVVESPDTKDQTSADALAASILAAQLVQWTEVRYVTLQTGLTPGMSQTITLAARGVDNTYLVTEVNTEDYGGVALRRVRATEGVVYKTGWREQARSLFGGGGSSARSLAGVVSAGGSGFVRFFVFLGGSASNYVQDATPTWVDASPMEVTIDTVPRGTLSADVTVQLRALEAGVSVNARLFDVTAVSACPGTSSTVTSTTWTTVTFTATLTAGSHRYKLQLLPGAANKDVGAIGYLL